MSLFEPAATVTKCLKTIIWSKLMKYLKPQLVHNWKLMFYYIYFLCVHIWYTAQKSLRILLRYFTTCRICSCCQSCRIHTLHNQLVSNTSQYEASWHSMDYRLFSRIHLLVKYTLLKTWSSIANFSWVAVSTHVHV